MPEEIQNQEESENGDLSKIERRLTEIDPKIFEGVPSQKKKQIIRSFVITMHKTHVGPLPDPKTLSEYSLIIPNGAERIMQMAERQLDHRMKMENKVVGGQMLQSNIGQILAFLIGIAALLASTYCIVTGHEWAGSILGIGGLTSLVTAFIKGRSQQERSLTEKR
ncbi:MAG: DUF2335 domain-containing protein [Cytophagales bacterium]